MLWETIYNDRNYDSLSHTYIASYIPKMESAIKTSLTKYTTYVASYASTKIEQGNPSNYKATQS